MGSVYGVQNGGAQVDRHHDGHNFPLGSEVSQIVGLLQLLQPGQAGLDDRTAPGALGLGRGHDLVGVAPAAGHQNERVFLVVVHRFISSGLLGFLRLEVHQGGG